MINCAIPYNYVEIDNIVKNLKEKEINLFINTQKKEGINTLLNTISNNLLSKKKKVAIIDLNTFFDENFIDNKQDSHMIFKLKNNIFLKVNKKMSRPISFSKIQIFYRKIALIS